MEIWPNEVCDTYIDSRLLPDASKLVRVEECHDLAKWLSQYLYLFSFLLVSDYYFPFLFLFFSFLIDRHAEGGKRDY